MMRAGVVGVAALSVGLACTEAGRSVVLVDLSAQSSVTGIGSVLVHVTQGGTSLHHADVNGPLPLKVGVYLPKTVSGSVNIEVCAFMTTSTTMREVIAAMNTPVPVTVTPGQTTGPVMVELQPGTPSLVCGGGAGGRGGTGGAAGSGAAGAPGTAGMGGSVVAGTGGGGVAGTGTAGATGGSGGASGRGGNGNTICAIPCSSSAYCDNGTCRTRITEFDVPTRFAGVSRIAAGPDGNLWFVENTARKIGRITPTGMVTEFDVPSGAIRQPVAITAGPDGNVWFAEAGGGIGRITPNGSITEFTAPTDSNPFAITTGGDGNLWYSSTTNHKIGKVTPTGTITEVDTPAQQGELPAITRGPDGNVWFLESGTPSAQLVQITPSFGIREFQLPTPNSNPRGLAAGADGNLWYTAGGKVGRMNVEGTMGAEFSTPSGSAGDYMTSGPDGNIWYASGAGRLGRVTPSGVVTEFPLTAMAAGIAVGADGNIWFTEANSEVNHIGRFLTP